jgi:predicted RNA-binding protein with PIN domain
MLLIDTYNVLHVTGVLPPEQAGIDVAGLISLIEAGRFRGHPALLVCDGRRPEGGTAAKPPIRVVYAGSRRTADDLIIAAVDRSTAPRRLIVVSSDQQILRAARRRRCRTLDSAEFLRRLAASAGQAAGDREPGRPVRPLGAEQVDAWLEQFGLTGDEHEEFAPPEEPAPSPVDEDEPPAAVEATDDELADELLSVVPPELLDESVDHGSILPPEVIEEAERLAGEKPKNRKAEKPK